MTQEQLRMQMLAGIITEGQYKVKLNEIKVNNPLDKSNYIDIEYPSGDYVGKINGDKITFHSILLDDNDEHEGEFDNSTLPEILDYLGPDHFFTQLVLKTEDEDGDVTAEFDIAGDEIEFTVGLKDFKSAFPEYIN